ncbi:hypothetical protein SAMN05660642_03498 [Geodermatophilus siccatus]|uniref:Uncharacterized protein n=2 Tax=Geodermatophilus siccatus TaxID=1137991 RepID=A0A1G9WR88_9ACTN|nr:hypothetical protein SAMN05660642_03498 [Geodermatophilus siccatus]
MESGMSLAVAMIVAAGFAMIGFPFNHLQAWISWGRWKTLGLLLVYLSTVAVGGGVIGWAIGSLARTQINPNDAVKGLCYGLIGSVLLRADFRSRRKPPAELRDAVSMLTSVIEWIRQALESVMDRAIGNWAGEQSPESLEYHSFNALKGMQGKLEPRQRRTQLELHTPAIENIYSSDDKKRKDARANLMAFLRTYYVEQHLPRPTLHLWQHREA